MQKSDLKIGFLTIPDPKDKTTWSGTYYRMYDSLRQEFAQVKCLGPVKHRYWEKKIMDAKLFIAKVFHRVFYGKKFNVAHNHTISKYYGRYFSRLLQEKAYKVDVLFAPVASVELAYLDTSIPVCYYSDATFSLISNYYDAFKNISNKSLRISNEIEQKAMDNSQAQVFSSQWAYESAKKDYGSKNTHIVKLGPNLDEAPDPQLLVKSINDGVNVLFVGVDWKRKGGDIVLKTLDILVEKGYKIKLTVCGCIPPEKRDYMRVIPFLNKNKKEDAVQLEKLYLDAHLFFMPTRADCTPISFCEANSFGLPVITTDTGGVSSVIEQGINGFLLPYDASNEDYAKIIESLILDDDQYQAVSRSSRKKYDEELNWTSWGKQMRAILMQLKS